jgi:methyl-accepting chemotaxis protein
VVVALENLRIGTKIYAVVGLLAAVAAGIGGMGIDAMRTYDAQVGVITRASQRATLGERVNGMILSVVMDSRGIYMARDRAESDKYGKPIVENLKRMQALMAQWKALLPDDQKDQFARAEANAQKFVEFRTELVRLGAEVGNPAARDYGDNDANRTNRAALNKEIEGLADQNNKLIAHRSAAQVSY